MQHLEKVTKAQTRSICAENPTGEKGKAAMLEPTQDAEGNWLDSSRCARDLGRGWKIRPCVKIASGELFEMADIQGPGRILHIWMTPAGTAYRNAILRVYWDDQEHPSIECPLGDFFASAFTGFDTFAQIDSQPVAVNPGNAFNCYWPMPFAKRCRMTIENRDPENEFRLYYQVDYELDPDIPQNPAYFHAQFRRTNPLPYGKVYTILDGVKGKGHYVGTYMAWGLNNKGWWGEGEIKFYLDGDIPPGSSIADSVAEHGGDCFPTIAGTGTEDYFGGSYNFENKKTKQYQEFTTAYLGVPHIVRPDGVYNSQTRFSMYRWHICDPIRFHEDLAVTIQAIGWRSGGRYLPLQDDIASVAFWYQQLPTAPFPELGSVNDLEII
ncbi:MAG: hypothetical protein CMJ19_23815 [Phycisphaeraceae bacterium]|nr:hypothetical protein [Phycisphaeraceae bacterium]